MDAALRRIPRPGAEIAFMDAGHGDRAVVLCHGAGMDRSMFDDQAAALVATGHRVIAWDLRGHGDSRLDPDARFTAEAAMQDLHALLDALDLRHAVLVGHSFGGNLVQAFTRRHPDRVGGLIVMDSTWNTGPLTRWERLGLRLAAPTLALIPAGSLPRIMARASAVTEPAVARTEQTFRRMPKRTFLDVWRATVSFVSPDPDHRSPAPLALIRGAEDRTGNIAAAMPRWAEAEGVDERVVPGAGHIVTWDAPAETSALLVGILDGWSADQA